MEKSNYKAALDVLAGKYGNGDDRYRALTAAGYNYDAVQSIVNAMIRDGYRAEPSNDNFLEITVDLNKYDGINLKFVEE